jgi:predicted metal-dependent hydrolase
LTPQTFYFQGVNIPIKYQVHRRYKNILLHVRPDHILVKSPRVGQHHVQRMLQENSRWIEEKLQHQQQVNQDLPDHAFYFGQALPITYGETFPKIDPEQSERIHLPLCENRPEALLQLKRLYAKAGKGYLPQRLMYWSEHMGLYPQQVRLKYLKSRWGSCSSRGNINLNYRAMQLSTGAIDAILIHELAHLEHLNHGTAFWNLVHRFCPQYDHYHQYTKKLGPRLV